MPDISSPADNGTSPGVVPDATSDGFAEHSQTSEPVTNETSEDALTSVNVKDLPPEIQARNRQLQAESTQLRQYERQLQQYQQAFQQIAPVWQDFTQWYASKQAPMTPETPETPDYSQMAPEQILQ